MDWISVNDRIPEEGFYLVVIDELAASKHRGVVEIGECFKTVIEVGGILKGANRFHEYVLFWQPLPEPPKDYPTIKIDSNEESARRV